MTTANDFAGKRCAIFGATSGIATEVARRLAASGARLVLVGRVRESLEASAQDLKVRGAADAVVHTADFADLDRLGPVADGAWEAFGGLDVALIAYGSLPDQLRAETQLDAAREALALNFDSPALLSLALSGHFRTAGFGEARGDHLRRWRSRAQKQLCVRRGQRRPAALAGGAAAPTVRGRRAGDRHPARFRFDAHDGASAAEGSALGAAG